MIVHQYKIQVRLPGDARTEVVLAARDYIEAKETAARIHGVSINDTNLVAVMA